MDGRAGVCLMIAARRIPERAYQVGNLTSQVLARWEVAHSVQTLPVLTRAGLKDIGMFRVHYLPERVLTRLTHGGVTRSCQRGAMTWRGRGHYLQEVSKTHAIRLRICRGAMACMNRTRVPESTRSAIRMRRRAGPAPAMFRPVLQKGMRRERPARMFNPDQHLQDNMHLQQAQTPTQPGNSQWMFRANGRA